MKSAWLGCLLLGCRLLTAGTQDSEFNVNSRYTVETVVLSGDGWKADLAAGQEARGRISSGLHREILAIIGQKLNPGALDDLAKRIRKEFNARTVEHHVLRGQYPDYVQVIFDIQLRPTRFDLSIPKLFYHSTQKWTGAVEGTATIHDSGITLGLVTDQDELLEGYTGVVGRYENRKLGTERLRLRFQVESYHQQWDPNTVKAVAAASPGTTSGIYRTRHNFEPQVVIALAKPLTLSVGASFEQFQTQFPAAHTEASNALISTLRYHRRLEGAESQHDLDADYNLRAATKVLHSDFAYTRHHLHFRYVLTRGKSVLIDELSAGLSSGRMPLFERFVLGNSSTLRGWNKYDLDPLGGNRMVHNSVEYRYGAFQIFYDAGTVWDSTETAVLRHSVGFGFRQGVFSLAVAFPVRDRRAEPIFMVGMNR